MRKNVSIKQYKNRMKKIEQPKRSEILSRYEEESEIMETELNLSDMYSTEIR